MAVADAEISLCFLGISQGLVIENGYLLFRIFFLFFFLFLFLIFGNGYFNAFLLSIPVVPIAHNLIPYIVDPGFGL